MESPREWKPPTNVDLLDEEYGRLLPDDLIEKAAEVTKHFYPNSLVSDMKTNMPCCDLEAELKQATATEYGLVFGSFELVAFLSSPILGKYLDNLGVRTSLSLGMAIVATTSIFFGMLDYVMDHNWFISLSFLLKTIEALGSTASIVAAFSVTAAVFPKSIGTAFATLEVFYGIGFIVGPIVGGFLFTLGGFKLPFVVNGVTMMLFAIVILFILPPIDTMVKDHQSPAGIIAFLKVPAVLLNSVCVVAVATSMGYYSAILEPHLRQFNLSPMALGLVFVANGGTYTFVAPVVGRICDHCDRWAYPKRVVSLGCLLIVLSFTIVGPAPSVPLPTTLPLCILGLMIHGVGLAFILVPTFMDSISSAVAVGFNDDITTYGILSGLWTASFSLGACIGPSVAGALYDYVGFRNGTLFIIIIHAVLFVVCTIFITLEKRESSPPNHTRLLSERIETEGESCPSLR